MPMSMWDPSSRRRGVAWLIFHYTAPNVGQARRNTGRSEGFVDFRGFIWVGPRDGRLIPRRSEHNCRNADRYC